MKKAYYCNHECVLVADLGDDAVIDIVVGSFQGGGGYDEPPYTECDERRIIVPKRLLTETRVDLEGQFNETAKKIREMERESRERLSRETREAKVRIDEIKTRVAKYAGLEQMMDYLDGKLKWAVRFNHYCGHTVIDLDKQRSSPDARDLAAVSFRKENYNKTISSEPIRMYLSNYSDDSGNTRYPITGFATEDEAVAHASELISKLRAEDIHSQDIETCVKYGLKIPAVDKAIQDRALRDEERKKEERARLERELSKLK